ncbi:MAG: phosphoribosylaminoimidazolesuccinocarboxamide synthase, partial [Alphaproteobacteria bacterium]|nr:phosphoribosylaminoimidazolesuccinocarboxamide synthase [Alphaproteobacteria bacterium]
KYEDTIVLSFKDTPLNFCNNMTDLKESANMNAHHQEIPGKGVINNRLSELFFLRLLDIDIDHHFMERLNMREQRIRATVPLPFSLIIHNVARDGLAKRMNFTQPLFLQTPIIEYVYKPGDGSRTLISEQHIESLSLASKAELKKMHSVAQRVNDFMRGQALCVGLHLDYMSLEFGHLIENDFYESDGALILIDELSADTIHFTDITSQEPLSGVHNQQIMYQEIAQRFQLLDNGGPKDLARRKAQTCPYP